MEKLLLTGEPGVGKSTILGKLQEKYPSQVVGILAREVRDDQGVRLGFTSGPLDNPALLTIAHVGNPSSVRVSRYGIDLGSLDQVAEQLATQLAAARDRNLVLIFDEIGLMQSYSDKLKRQIEEALDSQVPAVMAIKQDDSVSDWLKDIKQKTGVRLITVTETTRDEVLKELGNYIEKHTQV